VDKEFRIGKYEVTIQQYTDFLNAVAATDPYLLYDANMAIDLNIAGISRSGTSGGYSSSVINNGGLSGNRPITFVSWFDAARFANWMHNGQGSGSTETGAYTLVGGQTSGTAPAKNTGAQFYIPTENECGLEPRPFGLCLFIPLQEA
jgi:formylglycine-generating enzyme required for sulfatase activity